MQPVNHGKLRFEMISIDGRSYGVPYRVSDNQPWNEVAVETPGRFFIAVAEDGQIISAEQDPMMSQVVGPDIWEIDSSGPGEALRGKHWDGEKIE